MANNLRSFPALGLELSVDDDLFVPNPVTNRMVRGIRGEDITGKTVMDLGCGIGPLGIWAAKNGAKHVYASDVVEAEIDLARKNARYSGVEDKVTFYCGDIYAPVDGISVDTIIGDIAGLADTAGRTLGSVNDRGEFKPWYSSKVPVGGPDGTKNLIPLIEGAAAHLNRGGVLYFPLTVDLADGERIRAAANEHFNSVETVVTVNFPLTPDEVGRLRDAYGGNVPAFMQPIMSPNARGRYEWHGEIIRATEPK